MLTLILFILGGCLVLIFDWAIYSAYYKGYKDRMKEETNWTAIDERYERNQDVLRQMDENPLSKDEIIKRITELKEKVNEK